MHYDYMKGEDKFRLRDTLEFLGQHRMIGHGTSSSKVWRCPNEKNDYESALSLLSIIISGKIQDSCVHHFGREFRGKNPCLPDGYGAFFVVMKYRSIDRLMRELPIEVYAFLGYQLSFMRCI